LVVREDARDDDDHGQRRADVGAVVNLGSISSTFYMKLLPAQNPKAKKILTT